jgi:hypothetical protein
VADKLIMALLILTLYLNVGSKQSTENLINLSAVLFMWCVLPAFGASSYVPSIVLGEYWRRGMIIDGLVDVWLGPLAWRPLACPYGVCCTLFTWPAHSVAAMVCWHVDSSSMQLPWHCRCAPYRATMHAVAMKASCTPASLAACTRTCPGPECCLVSPACYSPAPADRGLFVRERNDGLYRTFTYLLAKIIEELVLALIVSVVAALMVFFAVGLAGSFLTFWLSYYVTLCNGIAVAYLVRACPALSRSCSCRTCLAKARALPLLAEVLLLTGSYLQGRSGGLLLPCMSACALQVLLRSRTGQ